MFPSIEVFGREIPMYGVMVAVGIVVCVLFYISQKKYRTLPEGDTELLIIFSCLGAFVGSKILYLLTVLPDFIADFPMLFSDPLTFLNAYFGGGYVFYGGLYGALAVAALYAGHYNMDRWEVARCLFPMVPLFHMFGRIGCFCAGCCYGVESGTFGIAFTDSAVAPNGVPLVPVQLMEAAGELILFLILWRMSHRENTGRMIFCLWMIAYGCLRFVLEFFRGDEIRGFVWVFSTSQVIALISVAFGVVTALCGGGIREEKKIAE